MKIIHTGKHIKNQRGERGYKMKLPTITYKGKKYYIDFRLQEIRDVKNAEPIKFIDIKEDKNSAFKKKLRAIRFRTWRQEYMAGVDD